MTPSLYSLGLPALFTRTWRMRLGRYAIRLARAFTDLAEWPLPEDLRRRL